jgi:hypothetical protein
MRNCLVFYVPTNSKGKRDGDEFRREATSFIKANNGYLVPVEYRRGMDDAKRMRDEINRAIFDYCEKGEKFDCVALFCHGWANGVQVGYRVSDGTVADLAEDLSAVLEPHGCVALYCCSTAHDRDDYDDEEIGAGTQGGFADELYRELDMLHVEGIKVDAHFTKGHTTRNPFVVRFEKMTPTVYNGDWLIEPGTTHWRRWVQALKGEMRLRFPLLSRSEIERDLYGYQPDAAGNPKRVIPRLVKNQA